MAQQFPSRFSIEIAFWLHSESVQNYKGLKACKLIIAAFSITDSFRYLMFCKYLSRTEIYAAAYWLIPNQLNNELRTAQSIKVDSIYGNHYWDLVHHSQC